MYIMKFYDFGIIIKFCGPLCYYLENVDAGIVTFSSTVLISFYIRLSPFTIYSNRCGVTVITVLCQSLCGQSLYKIKNKA